MPSPSVPIIDRHSARAILLTPDHDVLLFRIQLPELNESFWITPGGGLEPGETAEAALRRELQEELQLTQFEMGHAVWRRQHTFSWDGKRFCQREDYFVIHVARFEPTPAADLAMSTVVESRWWSASSLWQATERLTPLSLAEIVSRYIVEGPPRVIPPLEILVD
ncbi:NUDIX hydrolase [Schlesneria paludicola]|uniref:NUDIX hydrolase n=1 Tax=Schlesneria paludicola TaxID=360056 RepID=UPI00029B534C|nr:NUDIX domain-containing protein [Schlesneria paludicola]